MYEYAETRIFVVPAFLWLHIQHGFSTLRILATTVLENIIQACTSTMSNKPISRENNFRRFNESATSQERKLRSDEENVNATRGYNNSLVDSFHLPYPPSQHRSLAPDSALSMASATAACLSAGNPWDLTPFLSAAGTTRATTITGVLQSLAYSGLAGTSPRSCLGMNRFDRLLGQSTRMNFPTQFITFSSSNSFTATSRELTFKMDALDRLLKEIDLIPMIDKIDLLAALQVAPELVSKESGYFRFLRHANFDAKAAADKLVSYWKYRRSLFGDRAFRPMDMTGDGALTLEDIEMIKSGFIAYAPNDSEGCPVVIFDASRRNTDTAQVRMRGTFYHAQYLSEDSTAQTQGFVILCIVSVYRYDHTTMEAVSMLINTFPMKVKAWHTFDCIKDRNSLEQGFLLGFMEVFLHSLNNLTTYLYSAEAMEDIVWELATEHGLSMESLPNCIGGTWTYDMFQQWLVGRMSFEKNHYSQCPIDGTMSSESRRIHASPRPRKRSKWDEEEQSLEGDDDDDDAKSRAQKPLMNSYENECIEGLLSQFQRLLLHTSNINHETSAVHFTRQKPDSYHLELQLGIPSQDSLRFYVDKYDALEKALHAVSVHDKLDYMTAVHVAPELVLQESDPSRFLSFNGYNAEKAAQGIVRYWKQRRALFGERAFLPMTLTGTGALNAEDIQFQKCGNLAITGQDQQGCTVLVFDPSRRTTDDRGTRIRVLFYTWQVLFENPANQNVGFTAIHIARAPDYDKVHTESLQMVLSVFPVKPKAVHTFDLMTKIDLFRRGFIQGLIGIIVSAYTATPTFFHSPDRAEETLFNLETQHGLPRTVIPDSIGGSWSYNCFEKFRQERIMLEEKRYSTLANCVTTSTTIPSKTHLTQGAIAESSIFVSDQIARRNYHDVNDEKLSPPIPQRVHQEETTINARENHHILLLDGETRHLPAEETAEYDEAVRNAPQKLWEDECRPELFLRVEEFDARKAAIRIAKYWRWRSLVFGSSQYASLTQTGDNALGRKELSTLRTGFLNLLPYDIHGRSVLYIDPSLLQYDLYENARNRCIFYMMSLMTENDKSQSDGAILIVKVNPQHFGLVSAPLLDALSKALPLRITTIHLISQENVPIDLIRSLEPLNARIHVHSDQSKVGLLIKLESFGLTKAGLPKFVNGDWCYGKFVQWQELRTRIEWKIPSCLSGRACSQTSVFPAMKPYTLLSDDEAAERKRRMSLIHFRRKQNRIRVAVVMLKENCSDLRHEKTKLLQENQELEAKYANATSIVNNL